MLRASAKILLAALLGLTLARSAAAADAIAQETFFEKQIRPILVARCYECHSADNAESDLRVDSRAALLEGGKRGPAIIPGDAAKSLLMLAVNHADQLHMPPKSKIPQREIAALAKWVEAGATWPGAVSQSSKPAPAAVNTTAFTEQQRKFWSFQPPRRHAIPTVGHSEWSRDPIDAFIVAKLEQAGFEPAAPADRRTLIRRATFDLTGLPPTPSEVHEFLNDASPAAFAKVVDRLLTSPHYGEKWGRRWLDVVRYGDSNGLDENLAFANAYRYRDYVIRAFNNDTPYDRFLIEQIAGDLLPAGDTVPFAERLTATGFLVIGAKMLAEDDPMKMQMDVIDEQIDTLGKAALGMTWGCARCHDHKFDPISTADYYGLAGIFKSTRTMENFKVVARWQERPLEPQSIASPTPAATNAGQAAAQPPAAEPPSTMAVSEDKPQDVRIHLRGNHVTQGREVTRRFPEILTRAGDPQVPRDRSGRFELARWIASEHNPLTARVIVNRVWQGHFGTGIVRTADNFGLLGESPSHPELLDSLAVQFAADGWSIKRLHRRIMLSTAYQMSSQLNRAAVAVDPDDRLLWRWNRRRLEAEELRDAILACSGLLDETIGGSLLPTKNRQYVTSTASVNPVVYSHARRAVYLPVVRSATYDMFQAFDFPDPTVSNGERASTTVASQALFIMNGDLTAQASMKWAERLALPGLVDDASRLARLFETALARSPKTEEAAAAAEFLSKYEAELPSDMSEGYRRTMAWRGLCRSIFEMNEFLHLH